MSSPSPSDLRPLFKSLAAEALAYFEATKAECKPVGVPGYTHERLTDYYWDALTEELKSNSNELSKRLLRYCATLATLARNSPLSGAEDVSDVKESAKTMHAALRMRHYVYREPQTIHDEDVVLGFRPADQSESHASPTSAESDFFNSLGKINSVLKLVEAAVDLDNPSAPQLNEAASSRYRAGTAFVMMWMDSKQPDLLDTVDTVKASFGSFGIHAVRADDIEHDGVISARVLNEIRTSEFLFADLTGIRPNVYYEVGYAHALGKRVILFRKAGTGLHFDLAGYNCPEYENLRDLREKLTKRLVSMTGKNPSGEQEI